MGSSIREDADEEAQAEDGRRDPEASLARAGREGNQGSQEEHPIPRRPLSMDAKEVLETLMREIAKIEAVEDDPWTQITAIKTLVAEMQQELEEGAL
jgi:hypothetical protein